MKITVNYKLNQNGQKDAILKDVNAAENQFVEIETNDQEIIDLTEINSEGSTVTFNVGGMRNKALKKLKLVNPYENIDTIKRTMDLDHRLTEYYLKPRKRNPCYLVNQSTAFDNIQTSKEMLSFIKRTQQENLKKKKECAELNKTNQAIFGKITSDLQPKVDEKNRQMKLYNEQRENATIKMNERMEKEKENFEIEMLEWCKNYGSKRLWLAIETGLSQKFEEMYKLERVKSELKGVWEIIGDEYKFHPLDSTCEQSDLTEELLLTLLEVQENVNMSNVELGYEQLSGEHAYVIKATHKIAGTVLLVRNED